MMKKNILKLFIGIFILSLSSCCNKQNCKSSTKAGEHSTCSGSCEASKSVMTKETQAELTPDAILTDLMEGNKRYVAGKLSKRDLPAQVTATTKGQYPKAVILGCIDSRAPIEYIFDQGIGDIFVARVAGNIEDVELLGSIEYGVGVAGAKLIMVLGHEDCGAVKSAIKKVDVGSPHVTALLDHLEEAIEKTEGTRDAYDKCYFDNVIKQNAIQTVEDIRNKSAIIRNLEAQGKVKLVSAYYSLTDGKVTILDGNSCSGGHDHKH